MPDAGSPVITDAATILSLGSGSQPTRCFASNLGAGVLFVWRSPTRFTIVRIIATGGTLIVSRNALVSIPTNPDYSEYIAVAPANVMSFVHVEVKPEDRIYFYLTATAGNVTFYVVDRPPDIV